MIAALEKGANKVIANDISQEHLEVLKSRIPTNFQAKLVTIQGSFPNDLQFEEDSINAILISRVLHFFKPEILEKALQQILRWLAPDGKVFIICETPQSRGPSFLTLYNKQKKEGKPYPGLFESSSGVVHLLDKEILSSILDRCGNLSSSNKRTKMKFEIETIKTFSKYGNLNVISTDSVGVIARKVVTPT